MAVEFAKYLPQEIPDNFLSVREYGWQICPASHIYFGYKEYYVIHYVISGTGTFELNGKKYKLGKGNGFAINPKDYVRYYASADDPWVYTWVAFNGINAAHLLHLAGLTESAVFTCKEDKALKKYFYDLCSKSDSASAPEIARIGYLYLIFSTLINYIDISKDIKNKDFLKLAIEFMEKNFDKHITVSDVARHFSVSRSQLFRLFKEKMNIPPSQYLIDMRLSRACFYLESSDMPVCNVSSAVGFSDASYFSRHFKQKYSVSPTKYRQSHASENKL